MLRSWSVVLSCFPAVLGVLLAVVALPGLSSAALAKNSVKVNDKIFKSSSLLKILYPKGTGESQMPECERWSVCSRVDTYSTPWVERLCTCRGGQMCSTSLQADDGHTVVDKTRQYKVCESADALPICRVFKDITWTNIIGTDNKFQQRMHCKCPHNTTTYISGQDVKMTAQGLFFYYHFSCSPMIKMPCGRKEPCRLFSVRKRFPVEDVTTSFLCDCPPKATCPTHHTDPYVVEDYDSPRDGARTYS
ncbi:hypothetical protein X975_20472, partial [Stegodyphus mimosarum]